MSIILEWEWGGSVIQELKVNAFFVTWSAPEDIEYHGGFNINSLWFYGSRNPPSMIPFKVKSSSDFSHLNALPFNSIFTSFNSLFVAFFIILNLSAGNPITLPSVNSIYTFLYSTHTLITILSFSILIIVKLIIFLQK